MTTGDSDSGSSAGGDDSTHSNDDMNNSSYSSPPTTSSTWSQQLTKNGDSSTFASEQDIIAMRGFGPGGRVSAKRAEVDTHVIQVANIAPQATKEQMQALFGYIGKIEDLRLYPTMDIGMQHTSKICFVKFRDTACVGVAQHLTNTVFVDRALIVIPYTDGEAPDEAKGIELLNSGSVLPGVADPKLPQHVTSQLEGMPPLQVVVTSDPKLDELQLPSYPNLPPSYDSRRIEEIRRTIMVANIDPEVTAQDLLELFGNAGEIKYVRMCTRDNDPLLYALVEFTEQPSVLSALQCNGTEMGSKHIKVYHSTQAIVKPQAKTNEAAQKEIEEAMTRQAQNLITQGLDTNGTKEVGKTASPPRGRHTGSRILPTRRSRTRSRSPRRRSGSRSRRRRSRTRSRSPRRSRRSSRSRSRGRVLRSPWRHRSKSRSKERKRSTSKSHRSKRSSSKDRVVVAERDRSDRRRDKEKEKKSKRDKEKDKDRETKPKDRHRDSKDNGKENGVKSDDPPPKEESIIKERSDREKDRGDRHKDKERKRDRRKSHSKSPTSSKDKRRSTSRERRKRSKNKKKKRGDSDREGSVDTRTSTSRNTSVDREAFPMDVD